MEEFEGGEVRLKIAIAAPATNTAIQLTGISQDNSRSEAKKWYDFPHSYEQFVLPTKFLYESSADHQELANQEALFLRALSTGYMRPLSAALACDDTVIPPAASSKSHAKFVQMVNAWRVFALRKSFPSDFASVDTTDDLRRALGDAQSFIEERRKEIDRDKSIQCNNEYLKDSSPPNLSTAMDVIRRFEQINQNRKDASIDLYVISYIAVLVGDAFGIAEKERFLEKFGDIAKNTQSNKPAQLNFYNQIADAKNRSDSHWPIADFAKDNESASEIVDNILSTLTDAKLRDAKLQTICDTELANPPFTPEDELNLAKCVQGKKPNWDTLLDYYNFVKFRVEAQYIDAMNTAALAGRTGRALRRDLRDKWRGYFDELQAILSARSGDPVLYRESQSEYLSDTERDKWRNNSFITSTYEWNTFNSLALSAILLPEGGSSRRNRSLRRRLLPHCQSAGAV